MKKIFTLLALLTCFLGVKAEEVVDLEIDYTTVTSDAWNGGWRSDDAATRTSVVPGEGLRYHSDEATANLWDAQFQLPGVPSGKLDSDAAYTITIKIKGTVEQNIHGYFSGSDKPGDIPVTTSLQTLTFEGCQDNPSAQYFASSGSILIQCGDYVGDWVISYIKITHDEKPSARPVEWLEMLSNGDAETPWTDEQAAVKFTDTENTIGVVAWSKEKGHNLNETGDGWDPFPANIEVDPTDANNHVFVCHGQVADTPDQDDQKPSAWDNQFWIMSTKELKVGAEYKFHFRYRATENAKTNTQMHSAKPSDYLHYQVLGDVNFTTEWQTYDAVVAIPTPQNNKPIYSIAFNLNAENKNAIDFYFDDLSIQEMKLDNGLFVAASNATEGIEYNYDNAIEFVDGVDPNNEACKVATVGTKGKKDTWVNEIMISTVRGNTKSFKASTIKPSGTIKGNDADNWQDYAAGSNAKIALPAAGVWTIYLAPSEEDASKGQVLFMQEEGDEIIVKEPVDVVANSEVLVIKATERDDLSDQTNNETGEVTVREEEGGTGEPWDNQFWIAANRNLSADEVTIVEFDYVANKEAKTTTQCHKVGGDDKPCTYQHWSAIGDVNFTTEEQHFVKEFKIAAEADGMRSIAFNLSEIKDACDYTIKNVKWYLKNDTEGKTLENLIDATGTENFWVKINKINENKPYKYGTDPSGIINVKEDVVKTNGAIYNLAGQRVSKDYKGIVVKNGKKFIVK